jgi:hypothetical protein
MKYSWNPESGSTQVGFSLQNNSDYLIQFQIYNESAGMYHQHVLEILPNGEYEIRLNINVQTKLKIYYCPDSIACQELELPKTDSVETIFPLGKTIYISWDGKELLPQNEGQIPYTTKAGYYLTNNVQTTDYTLTFIKSAHIVYPKEIGRSAWDIFPNAREYAKTLRVAEAQTDATVFQLTLGIGGTPSEDEINRAWQATSAPWNPDNHPDEPNFARAVMKLINRARDGLFNSVIKPLP